MQGEYESVKSHSIRGAIDCQLFKVDSRFVVVCRSCTQVVKMSKINQAHHLWGYLLEYARQLVSTYKEVDPKKAERERAEIERV